MPRKDKKPRAAAAPTVHKRVPKAAGPPPQPTGCVVLRFDRVDTSGPWCLSKAEPAKLVEILDNVSHWESMRPNELFGGHQGKDYTITEIPNARATCRLTELAYDDQTKISRLNLQGKGRLYGFRRDPNFHVLWWDPEHEIWPSRKR